MLASLPTTRKVLSEEEDEGDVNEGDDAAGSDASVVEVTTDDGKTKAATKSTRLSKRARGATSTSIRSQVNKALEGSRKEDENVLQAIVLSLKEQMQALKEQQQDITRNGLEGKARQDTTNAKHQEAQAQENMASVTRQLAEQEARLAQQLLEAQSRADDAIAAAKAQTAEAETSAKASSRQSRKESNAKRKRQEEAYTQRESEITKRAQENLAEYIQRAHWIPRTCI